MPDTDVGIGVRVVNHTAEGMQAVGRSFGSLSSTITSSGLGNAVRGVASAFGTPIEFRAGVGAIRGGWGLLGALSTMNRFLIGAASIPVGIGLLSVGLAALVPTLLGINASAVQNWERFANSIEIMSGVTDAEAKSIIDIVTPISNASGTDARDLANVFIAMQRVFGEETDVNKITGIVEFFGRVEGVGGEKAVVVGNLFAELVKVFEVPQTKLDSLASFLLVLSQDTGVSQESTISRTLEQLRALQSFNLDEFSSTALSALFQADSRISFGEFAGGLSFAADQGFDRQDIVSILNDRNKSLEEIAQVVGAQNARTFQALQGEGHPFETIRGIFEEGETHPYIVALRALAADTELTLNAMEDDQTNFFSNLREIWSQGVHDLTTTSAPFLDWLDDLAVDITNKLVNDDQSSTGVSLIKTFAAVIGLANPVTMPRVLQDIAGGNLWSVTDIPWLGDAIRSTAPEAGTTQFSATDPGGRTFTSPNANIIDALVNPPPGHSGIGNRVELTVNISPTGSLVTTTEDLGDIIAEGVNELVREAQTQRSTARDNTGLTTEAAEFLAGLGLTP